MARPIRIEHAGAAYHLMARGNQGQAIFAGDLERTLKEGLKVLNLAAGSLAGRAKGLAEKQVLAWWLRRRTIMGRRWVNERLWMGEESGVSRAVRRVAAGRDRQLERIKQQWLAMAGGGSK